MTSEERMIRVPKGFTIFRLTAIDESGERVICAEIPESEPAPPKDYWEGPYCYNGEPGKKNCNGAFPEKNDYHPTCVECPYRKRE
jgi:hypothetical protein